jgi:hypothetical protein
LTVGNWSGINGLGRLRLYRSSTTASHTLHMWTTCVPTTESCVPRLFSTMAWTTAWRSSPPQVLHLGDGSRSQVCPHVSQDRRITSPDRVPVNRSFSPQAGQITSILTVLIVPSGTELPELPAEVAMLKKLSSFAFFTALAYGFGMMARQLFLGSGDETTGAFELVTIMEGKQFVSRADQLHSGKVTTVMGGVDLDLRDAVLAPGGADLAVFTVMGGVALRVPDTWIVETVGRAVAGGHETRVAKQGVLPPGAPVLRVHASTFFGGLDIAAKPKAA